LSSKRLVAIASEVLVCTKCPLSETRRNAVLGEGNAKAEIMLIGEAPGRSEDLQGRPFVGSAGKFLEILLGEIGLSRTDGFICNILKCIPPKNRPTKHVKIFPSYHPAAALYNPQYKKQIIEDCKNLEQETKIKWKSL